VVAASTVGLAIAVLHAADAMAAGSTHALTCIGTETGESVNFSYRWGPSRDWKSTAVQPGKWLLLSWRYKYADYNRSPQLEFRYDDDSTDGAHFVHTKVRSYAVSDIRDCENQGFRYEFRLRGNEVYLLEVDN
jgi:hypothetical protein